MANLITRINLIICVLLLCGNASAQAPDTLWSRIYGGYYDDDGWDVRQTSDGGFIMTGYTQPHEYGDNDVYLVKIDADGATIWTRTFGDTLDDEGRAVRQTPDGGYIITGYTKSFGAGGEDIYLIKTDSLGDTQWTRTYGDLRYQEARSLELTPNGDYVLAGWTNVADSGEDIYILKTDSTGNLIWDRRFGGQYDDRGWSIISTSDSGYAIAGWSYNNPQDPGQPSSMYIIKTNRDGDTLWTRFYRSRNGEAEARSIAETPDSGFIVVGQYGTYNGQRDSCSAVMRLNQNGDSLWLVTLPYKNANSVAPTHDGCYVISGYGLVPWSAGFIAKIDIDGHLIWLQRFGSSEMRRYARSAMQTSDGGFIVTGYLISVPLEASLVRLAPDQTDYVDEGIPTMSVNHVIVQSYPNPFNAQTTISYSLPQAGPVALSIYNIMGQKVATLFEGIQQAGENRIVWNAKDLPSGVYFSRLKINEKSDTQKMILLK